MQMELHGKVTTSAYVNDSDKSQRNWRGRALLPIVCVINCEMTFERVFFSRTPRPMNSVWASPHAYPFPSLTATAVFPQPPAGKAFCWVFRVIPQQFFLQHWVGGAEGWERGHSTKVCRKRERCRERYVGYLEVRMWTNIPRTFPFLLSLYSVARSHPRKSRNAADLP